MWLVCFSYMEVPDWLEPDVDVIGDDNFPNSAGYIIIHGGMQVQFSL